jgi:hypothetical protein
VFALILLAFFASALASAIQLALQDFSNSVNEFQVQEEAQIMFKLLAFLNQQRLMFQVGYATSRAASHETQLRFGCSSAFNLSYLMSSIDRPSCAGNQRLPEQHARRRRAATTDTGTGPLRASL